MENNQTAEILSKIIHASYPKSKVLNEGAWMVPYITDRKAERSMSMEDLLQFLLRSPYPLVMLGEPGCGKTTIINRLALELCNSNWLPLIVRLRLMRSHDSLFDIIARSLTWDLRDVDEFTHLQIKASHLSNLVKHIFSSQKVVLFLDGLNEVSRDLFDSAATEIQNAFEEYNWQRFILTNRTTNLDLMGKFTLFDSPFIYHRGLSPDSAKLFIDKNADLAPFASRIMISEIDRGGKISTLLLNPQRLLLSCRFYIETGNLPSTLAEIFYQDLQYFASKRDPNIDVPVDFQFKILSTIAAEMTSRGTLVGDLLGVDPESSVSFSKVLGCIPQETAVGNWLTQFDMSDLLEIFKTCLDCPFIVSEKGQFSFIHESYQDFFSSLWLGDNLNYLSGSDLYRIGRSPSWEEAFVFVTSVLKDKAKLDRIIDIMLKSEDGVFLMACCAFEMTTDMAQYVKPRIAQRLAEIVRISKIPELRVRAMDLLHRIGEIVTLHQLVLHCYTDDNWMVRETAALYAGSIKISDSPKKLALLFYDQNHWVRAAAVWAAGEANLTQLKSKLSQCSQEDTCSVVRQWAKFALQRLEKRFNRKISKSWYEEYMVSEIFSGCNGKNPAEFYTSGLSSNEELVRSTSVEAISEMQYFPAFKKMRALCSDISPYVRAWLMRSIGEADVFSCSDILIAGIADSDTWVRFWAIESIGILKLKIARDEMIKLLSREADANVLRAVIWSLCNMGTLEALDEIEKHAAKGRVAWSPEIEALVERLRQRITFEGPFSITDFTLRMFEHRQGEELQSITGFIKAHEVEIKALATVFTQYQRPDGIIITELQVERWLRQFKSIERMTYALRLLHNVDFYTRRRMAEIFESFLESSLGQGNIKRTTASILGNPSDSSSLVNYVIREVLTKHQIESQDLKSILASSAKKQIILFVDDNIGSGKQSIQIFREWLKTGERILNEHHVVPLSKRDIERLRNCEICIFTCLATHQGCKSVYTELNSLGLNVHSVSAFYMADQKIGCFHPTSNVFLDSEEREKAKEMAREIGVCLLQNKDWPEDRKKEYALGYGGAEKLIVFFYNVPTTTLPILWKAGYYHGQAWFPLFLRREKL